jgi:hypothetical protein
MQTNELRNAVVDYLRAEDGKVAEVDRVATDGAASGEFKPTSGQESANALRARPPSSSPRSALPVYGERR